MKQSISEVFTLDVLQNYNTFKRYFQLVKNAEEDKVYETARTLRALTNYVDLQPHSIETKTKIMLEHFVEHTAKTIGSKGRAMLITRSRLHCVRYKLEFGEQMREMSLPYGCLVAFSGAVHDTDNGAGLHRERHERFGAGRLHPRHLQESGVSDSDCVEQVPDRFRRADAPHHVRR